MSRFAENIYSIAFSRLRNPPFSGRYLVSFLPYQNKCNYKKYLCDLCGKFFIYLRKERKNECY
jgi:hypothetical protein